MGDKGSAKSRPAKPVAIKPNGIDFESLAREHGYVKARQLLAQAHIQSQQTKIRSIEAEMNDSKRPLRVKESIRLASSYGNFNSDSVLDRVMKGNQAIMLSESAQIDILEELLHRKRKPKESPAVENLAAAEQPVKEVVISSVPNSSGSLPNIQHFLPRSEGAEYKFTEDDTLRHTLESDSYTLLIANQERSELPAGLGDTLNLQLGYCKRLICTRNNLRSLLTHKTPQLSMYHLRYLKQANLSLNKLSHLPSDFGVLTQLETLDLSHNNLSSLPESIRKLKRLVTLNLSGNSFSSLPAAFAYLDALNTLDLSNNLFTLFPWVVIRLRALKSFKFNRNSLTHLAVPPPLLRVEDMWTKVIDRRTGKTVNMNILTNERIANIEKYDGHGVRRMRDLHVFQPEGTKIYRKRKVWLAVNQIQEWEPDTDVNTGLVYYRNNVSGGTSWSMPEALDTLGDMQVLEDLEIKMNSIKALPDSFIRMTNLRKLVFTKNRLASLPDGISSLKSLVHLEVASNELRILPVTICECDALEVLILSDNHLLRLPANLGRLPRLRKLDVSSNHLRQIAHTLGFCETLETLNVLENPLEDPPMEEFSNGMDTVKWYLRNRYHIESRGMPPIMDFHQIGICGQVTVLQPEFSAIVRQLIASSKKDGLLNMQLLGLKAVPAEVLKIPHLRRLKLDFNDHLGFDKEGFPLQLSSLVTLSVRACRLEILPDNVHIFGRLTTLSIHENRFESLPDTFSELRALTCLDVSKNRLYRLPDGFERLTKLTTLNLEANNLEDLPDGLHHLVRLKTLNLSKNRLVDCPDNICAMRDLKVLNLEKNRLQYLPGNIAHLPVVELRVGHNRIEMLAGDMFAGALGETIKVFSCCENNIMELPWSLTRIDPEALLEADFNPYISPPPYLLSEGLHVTQNYLHIRHVRRSLFEELIADEDFVIEPGHITPQAFEVLQDGTGFLTPDDLAEFDQAVDEYLNGEYFTCPSTAEEIVESITKLRDYRETEIYLNVLNATLRTIEKLVAAKDPRFPPSAIATEQRPWGRRSEMVNVWVVSLVALLRDCAPNLFQKDGRPSLFNLIEQELPPLAFPFTVDLLKDSLRLYESPYGQVADTEQVTFPSCECVDEARNKPKRHNPCTKAAMVLVKSLYVPEEADRREIEEDEFLERFRVIEDEVRIWLQTEEGTFLQEKEIKRRKAALREEIVIREEMIMSQQLKLKKATDTLNSVNKRKDLFEASEAYESHGFRNAAEVIRALNEANDEITKLNNRVTLLNEQIKKLKEDLNQDFNAYIKKTTDDIIQKYCGLAYNKHVQKHRFYALKHKLKRHWDGEDGRAFAEWLTMHSYAGDTSEMDAIMAELGDRSASASAWGGGGANTPRGSLRRQNSAASVRSDTSAASSKKDEGLPPEYLFTDTDDMGRYTSYIYSRYRTERDESFFD